MANRAEFTETLLDRCRQLGRVRVVLRNATGLSELFADLADLEQAGGWANLISDTAHVHLTTHAFGAVAFRTVSSQAGRAAPAVWLYANQGCPTVLFVLDQAEGEEAEEQAEVYAHLHRDFGPFLYLVPKPSPRETGEAVDGQCAAH